jgi:hypothetical protein
VVPESHSGAVQAGLDRAGRNNQDPGYFVVRKVVKIPQDQDQPVVFPQVVLQDVPDAQLQLSLLSKHAASRCFAVSLAQTTMRE